MIIPTTWQTKYTLEVYLHEQLLKSPLRTKDPEEANLFYVPLYISCFMHARATNFYSANDMVQNHCIGYKGNIHFGTVRWAVIMYGHSR